MHISHDFTETNTCPGYEFLVVFGQVRVFGPKKCEAGAGWDDLRDGCGLEVCGVGTDKISQTYAGAGRV